MASINIHLPYKMRKNYFPVMIKKGFAPEFYFEGGDFADLDMGELEDIAETLKNNRLVPSIHAPFLDINLAATDPEIVKIVKSRLLKTIELAKMLNANGIVIHPGYDPYRYRGMDENWFVNISRNLPEILKKAEDCKITLSVENIFEESCANLKKLLRHFSSPYFGHCFDTGHFNIFSRVSLAEWLNEMKPFIFSLHIHDNLGFIDQHLAVGDGSFPFKFFAENLPKKLRWVTMEMRDETAAAKSFRNWNKLCGKNGR